jgi:hypothetical protein
VTNGFHFVPKLRINEATPLYFLSPTRLDGLYRDNILHYNSEADCVTATGTEMRTSQYVRHTGNTVTGIFAYSVPAYDFPTSPKARLPAVTGATMCRSDFICTLT